MPLPWKKPKTNRISRIVADLQPPSRGASLVVETGFPTSVIDLFVKNRDRIKRQSHKKNKKTKHFPPPDAADSLAPPPTPSPSPDNSPNCSGPPLQFDPLDSPSPTPARELQLQLRARGDSSNANAKSNGSVFVLAVKMFLVAIPAFSTGKLALWIALCALLLLLLEILGKFAVTYSIWKRLFPESETTTATERLIDRRREEEASNSASNEIQLVESSSDHEHEGLQEEFLSREIKLGYMDEIEEVGKGQRSRSAKLKAKINKLIPKKLRSGKRVKSNKNKNKTQLGAHDQEHNDHGSASSCEEEEEDHEEWEVGMHQNWRPEETGKMVGKGEGEGEGEEEEMKKLECISVVVMILLGLLWGRFVALVLAVSGCLMFKFIKILNQKWKFG